MSSRISISERFYSTVVETARAASNTRSPATKAPISFMGYQVWLVRPGTGIEEVIRGERLSIAQKQAKEEQDAIWRARYP